MFHLLVSSNHFRGRGLKLRLLSLKTIAIFFVVKKPMCTSVFPEHFRELKEKDETILIDVRNERERYEEGSIPGHELIDVESPTFSLHLDNLDKQKTYLVYCKTGIRGQRACDMMKRRGFERVVNLEGGIEKWKSTFIR
jgi:rhodanese-related sulfurtransferase